MSKKKRGKNPCGAEAAFPAPDDDANLDAAIPDATDTDTTGAGDGAAETFPEDAEVQSDAEARYREQRGRGRSPRQIRATAMNRDDRELVSLCDDIIAGNRLEPGEAPASDEAGLDAEVETARDAAGEPDTLTGNTHTEPDNNEAPDVAGKESDDDEQGGGDDDVDLGLPCQVRTNEEPLEFFYARRAEGVTIAGLRAYAEQDNDDDVLELCDRMEPIESGLPRFTTEQLDEIEERLDTFHAKMRDCEASMGAAQSLLYDCLHAYRRESGRSPRRVRSGGSPRPARASSPRSRISLLTAAAMLLAETGEAMNCRTMLETIMRRGIWSSPSGKTPEATLNGGIVTEIRDKEVNSRFQKVAPGQFAATPLFIEMHRKSGLTLALYETKPDATGGASKTDNAPDKPGEPQAEGAADEPAVESADA